MINSGKEWAWMDNNKKLKIEEMHESPLVMLIPLIVLAVGAIFAGFLFKDLFIGHGGENNFWGESIKVQITHLYGLF